MNEFIIMSGYGVYVFPAYIFFFTVLGILWFSNILKLNKKEKLLDKLKNNSE